MDIFGLLTDRGGGGGAKRPHHPPPPPPPQKGPSSLKSDTYPTMMKLGTVIAYLEKIQKTYESSETPSVFC